MSQNVMPSPKTKPENNTNLLFTAVLFMLVAIIGLFIVKWSPYYAKAFLAAQKHSIGNSIITGKSQVAAAPSFATAWEYTFAYFKAVWKAVILGLLLGSLVQVLIPSNWIKKIFGKTGFGATAAASVTALPGMMCSCCAAPLAVGLRKQKASINATLAFFLANPVLNPATIIFMGFVLSWKFAMFRVIIGLLLVLGISTMAGFLAKEEDINEELSSEFCEVEEGSIFSRWLKALWALIVDTIPAYVIVVVALGAVRAWLFPALGPAMANSVLAIIGLSIAGTLFVIPTAAEIPVVQTLMSFGMGVGPASALLITLPAVNLPSLLIIKRAFSTKILLFVTVSVILFGIIAGLAGSMFLA